MNEEHAYAYEAGYRDGSVHYELEHCPACKNVADLQEALDENAKLRELADAPKCETCEAMLDCDECLRADGSHKERRRLDYENAKLRELVKSMYYDLTQTTFPPDWVTDYEADMRELGVEP